MKTLTRTIEELLHERDLRKGAADGKFSLQFPNKTLREVEKELADMKERRSELLEHIELLAGERRQYSDDAQKAYEECVRKKAERRMSDSLAAGSGRQEKEPRIDDFLPSAYRKVDGELIAAEEELVFVDREIAIRESDIKAGLKKRSYVTREDRISDYRKNGLKPTLIGIAFGISVIHLADILRNIVTGTLMLNRGYFNRNVFWCILSIVFPIIVWLVSTRFHEPWGYLDVKLRTFYIAFFTFVSVAVMQLGGIVLPVVRKIVAGLPLTVMFTEKSAVWFGRTLMILVVVPLSLILFARLHEFFSREENLQQLEDFVFLKYADFRGNKNYAYDNVSREKRSGRELVTYEHDLMTMSYIHGPTGSGKTSLVLKDIIRQKLDQMVFNMDHQKTEIQKMLEAGKVRIREPFADIDFDISKFEPSPSLKEEERERVQEELSKLERLSPVAALCVLCPNEDLADWSYEMAKARNIKVMRMDPIREKGGGHKPDWSGFNSMHISSTISGVERYDDIVTKASVLMSVLSDMNEEAGKVDAYFASVNNIQTNTVAKLLMLTNESLTGRQPNMKDLYTLLADYREMKPYLFELVRLYGNNGRPVRNFPTDIEQMPEKQQNLILDKLKVNCGIWQSIYTIVRNEFLDEKLGPICFERANGLRNQLDLFLSTPRVNDILTADRVVDLDMFFKKGGVLILNYALELGDLPSKTLGELMLKSYTKAMLRRDLHEFCRPAFLYVDEWPTIASASDEALLSLGRQYRNCTTLCFQTFSQFEKSNTTKFMLQSAISNCRNKYVLGGITSDEADVYEKLGGVKKTMMQQSTVSETSITMSETQLSKSVRETPQEVPYMSASEYMMLPFKDYVLFRIFEGSKQRPVICHAEFLTELEELGQPRPLICWERYYDRMTLQGKEEEDGEEEEDVPVLKNIVNTKSARRRVRGISATGIVYEDEEAPDETKIIRLPQRNAEPAEEPPMPEELPVEGDRYVLPAASYDPTDALRKDLGL